MTRLTEKGIQLSPPGLLNLLQLKTGGINPDDLQREITPSIDLEQWWLRAARKKLLGTYTQAVGAGAIDAFFAALGPGLANAGPGPSEWWYVHNCTMQASVIVGTATNLQFCVAEQGGPFGVAATGYRGIGEFVQTLAIGTRWNFSQEGFWMPPGSSLGLYVGTVGAGATFSATILNCGYTPLPI